MAVNDIKKLRPELLTKSRAELERQATEVAMALAELDRAEEVAAKETLAADANRHIDAILAGVKFLHDNAILPERLTAALSRGDGQFNPATFLRSVTAESLAGAPRRAAPSGEKRSRRVRDADGNLVPSKASLK